VLVGFCFAKWFFDAERRWFFMIHYAFPPSVEKGDEVAKT
jgi:hypothetical protein